LAWQREKRSSWGKRVISVKRQENKSDNLSLETPGDSQGNQGKVTARPWR